MKGATILGNKRVVVRDFPDERPGVNEVKIGIRAATICGSDLRHSYLVDPSSEPDRPWGERISGHEPCGVIEEVGEGVTELSVGDRVVVYHIRGCGQCEWCRSGWILHCNSKKAGSHGLEYHGAFGEYLVTDAANCVPLPDNLSFADGACCACGTGTAWQALSRLRLSGDDSFIGVGMGPVGLSAVLLASALGARVIAVDLVPERLELAKELGAHETINSLETDLDSAVSSVTRGKLCSCGADFSGSTKARDDMLRNIASWGRAALVGEGNTLTAEVSPQIIRKQLSMYGSWVFSIQALTNLLAYLSERDLHPERMITAEYPLDRIEDAFENAASQRGGKVLVLP